MLPKVQPSSQHSNPPPPYTSKCKIGLIKIVNHFQKYKHLWYVYDILATELGNVLCFHFRNLVTFSYSVSTLVILTAVSIPMGRHWWMGLNSIWHMFKVSSCFDVTPIDANSSMPLLCLFCNYFLYEGLNQFSLFEMGGGGGGYTITTFTVGNIMSIVYNFY